MKKLIFSWLLSVLVLSIGYGQNGTERSGYDGDFFSLEGTLDLFKQSNNLRDFERQLNTRNNWVNNLDLNYDGRTDYIRVEHRRQGDFHAIVLQALLDRRDIQDVAVIEIEITNRREAILQIIGDEDLYGEEVIVEPREGYSDSRRGYRSDYGDFVNVYYWEPVQNILGRQYRVYASPYRWQSYPTYWRPWAPCTWNIFRPRIVVYQRYYHVVRRHRVIRVHNFYRPRRAFSIRVVERTNVVRVRQGRTPIYRQAPTARQDGRSSETRRRNDVVERPRTSTRSTSPRQNPSVSRKKMEAATGRTATRSSIPRTDQRSRSSINSSETPRSRTTTRSSTPSRKPSVSSRSTSPSVNQRSSRSSSPTVRQPSRSTTTTTRSRTTTRSTTPARKPSVSSRSTPARTQQSSRSERTRSSTPTRSKTSTRSTTPSRKPTSSVSKRSAPVSKSQATRSRSSSSSKSSSSKSSSRSRRGGGDF